VINTNYATQAELGPVNFADLKGPYVNLIRVRANDKDNPWPNTTREQELVLRVMPSW
jgi:D-methionine transport system substrate-binding protein